MGSLKYLICTKPNILYAIRVVSHFMGTSTFVHTKAAKRILCYIKGILDFRLFYYSSSNIKLARFCDSNFTKIMNNGRNTVSFVRVIVLSHGAQRHNLLSHFQHVNLNMW